MLNKKRSLFSFQCLTPATATVCWTILGELAVIDMLLSYIVTRMSPGAAGIGSSLTTLALISQTHVLTPTAVAQISQCGLMVDTQQLGMESSLC